MKQLLRYCCLCQQDTKHFSYLKIPSFAFGFSVNIQKCSVCGLGNTLPVPSINEEYYKKNPGYVSLFNENLPLFEHFADETYKFITDAILNLQSEASRISLLDVGAGRGVFVKKAVNNDIDAIGIEPNEENLRLAKEANLPLYESIIDIPDFTEKKFDVILFSNVIEHVENFMNFLDFYRSYLKDGGVIVLVQAAHDGLIPSLVPYIWYAWSPREHFFHFDIKSLRALSEKIQSKQIYFRRSNLYYSFASPLSLKGVAKNITRIFSYIAFFTNSGDQIHFAIKIPAAKE